MLLNNRFFGLFAFCLILAFSPIWGHSGVYEGVSDPKKSEAEALIDARYNAYHNLAASFSTYIDGIYQLEQMSKGTNLDDVVLAFFGYSNSVIRMHLTGIEEKASSVEKTDEGFVAHVFISITEEGRKKAEKYVEQETVAFRAYDYFSRKFNFPSVLRTSVPKGYSDFSTWLNSNCLIFEVTENRNDFLIQFEYFLRKLNRKISVFTDKLEGKQVRIIYNTPDYYNDITNVLRKMNIKVFKENGHVLLIPEISIVEFKNQIQRMPDAGIITVAGISMNDYKSKQISSNVLNEVASIAGKNYGLKTQILHIPDQYLNDNFKDTEIINIINGNARYSILVKAETKYGTPIIQYGIPQHNWVSYRCILHDVVTGKSIYSNSTNGGFSFSGSEADGKIPADFIKIIYDLLENL